MTTICGASTVPVPPAPEAAYRELTVAEGLPVSISHSPGRSAAMRQEFDGNCQDGSPDLLSRAAT